MLGSLAPLGFKIQRRKARGDDWETITDYTKWGPLVSKGSTGGTYRYVDNTADIGGWVYRISEVEKDGNESDLCQCLVEIQSQGEKIQGIVAAVGIAAIAIGAVVAGVTLAPIQSGVTKKGGNNEGFVG